MEHRSFNNVTAQREFHIAHTHASARGHFLGPKRLGNIAGFLFNAFGNNEKAMTLLGEDEAIGFAVEQLDRQVLLEFSDATADSGVIDAKPARRWREPVLASKFKKKRQIVPVKHVETLILIAEILQ